MEKRALLMILRFVLMRLKDNDKELKDHFEDCNCFVCVDYRKLKKILDNESFKKEE